MVRAGGLSVGQWQGGCQRPARAGELWLLVRRKEGYKWPGLHLPVLHAPCSAHHEPSHAPARRSEFIFVNPNANSTCGCGESFTTTGSSGSGTGAAAAAAAAAGSQG